MRTRVFSPTYPTWVLVGGTSRPAGETVYIHIPSCKIKSLDIYNFLPAQKSRNKMKNLISLNILTVTRDQDPLGTGWQLTAGECVTVELHTIMHY